MCSFQEKKHNIQRGIYAVYKLIQTFPRPFYNTLSNSPKNIFKVIEGKKSAKCFVYKRHV